MTAILPTVSFASAREAPPASSTPGRVVSQVGAPSLVAEPRKLDVTRLPFRVVMEVKHHDAAALNRALRGTGFVASEVTEDCSHRTISDGGFAFYCCVTSPLMTLADGGLDKVTTALEQVQKMASTPGSTAATHILVSDEALDAQCITNLVNMHLANEAIIYRLGNAGGAGRTMNDKMKWACPLSNQSPQVSAPGWRMPCWGRARGVRSVAEVQSVQAWRSQLSNAHWGLNASQKGFWQFRYFDTSFDPQSMTANLRLVMGMVDAAAEGRGTWDQVRPLRDTCKAGVPRAQWDAFMRAAAPADLWPLFESNFLASGGKFKSHDLPMAVTTVMRACSSFVRSGPPDRALPPHHQGVVMEKWQDVYRAVHAEGDSGGEPPETHFSALIQDLQHHNVQFFTSPCETGLLHGLSAAVFHRAHDTKANVEARLPRWVFWGHPWPARHVTISTAGDIDRLAEKLHIGVPRIAT